MEMGKKKVVVCNHKQLFTKMAEDYFEQQEHAAEQKLQMLRSAEELRQLQQKLDQSVQQINDLQAQLSREKHIRQSSLIANDGSYRSLIVKDGKLVDQYSTLIKNAILRIIIISDDYNMCFIIFNYDNVA